MDKQALSNSQPRAGNNSAVSLEAHRPLALGENLFADVEPGSRRFYNLLGAGRVEGVAITEQEEVKRVEVEQVEAGTGEELLRRGCRGGRKRGRAGLGRKVGEGKSGV